MPSFNQDSCANLISRSKKEFVDPFIDAVRALSKARGRDRKIEEFKRFVNEFGTHYSSTTEMGTRLSIERRYTKDVTCIF